jgi:hypothetical protein
MSSDKVLQQEIDQKLKEIHATRTIESFCSFLASRYGCVLGAWRRALDPDGDGELLFTEFIDALVRTSWHGDTGELWSSFVTRANAAEGEVSIGLKELSPVDHDILEGFRCWMDERFGGAVDMFEALAGTGQTAHLTLDGFVEACRDNGFHGEAKKIFTEALDEFSAGVISLPDMAYLERDALRRKAAVDPTFQKDLEEAKVAANILRSRRIRQRQAQESALLEFKQKLRAAHHGSFIRGWRTLLDLHGNLTFSKIALLKCCRKIAFTGSDAALWKAVDSDDDGTVHLQEVEMPIALALGVFKKWASDRDGNCVATVKDLAKQLKKKTAKWTLDELANALRLAGFPPVVGMKERQAIQIIHEACDLKGVGYITENDVAFIDKWEPTPWLTADPDYDGKDKLLEVLRARYPNLIVAWRQLLDKSNTNCVSYNEFSAACNILLFKNVAGIWSALDEDKGGSITLEEIDPHGAERLMQFKEWAESTFGSIQRAYRVLDETRSNAMSLSLFKRGLNSFGYKGDAKDLFASLKPEGGRHAVLRLEDMKYLASWDAPDTTDKDSSPGSGAGTRPASAAPCELRVGRKSSQTAAKVASPSQLSMPPEMDRFFYCKSVDEWALFDSVRDQRGKKHNLTLNELLMPRIDGNVRAATAQRKSPYGAGLVQKKLVAQGELLGGSRFRSRPVSGCSGSGRSMAFKTSQTLSLPALEQGLRTS